MDFLIQLIGFIGIVFSLISFQCAKHRGILLWKAASEFTFGVQYFLLGAYTGTAMEAVGCVRNLIFTNRVEKGKDNKLGILIFSPIFLIFGLITWQGWTDLLGITAKILSTVAYGNKRTSVIRIVVLFTSGCWLIYNVYYFSLAGILCELFTLVSAVIGLFRHDIKSKSRKDS